MECKPLLILAPRLKYKSIQNDHNYKDISTDTLYKIWKPWYQYRKYSEEKFQVYNCRQLLKLSSTQNKMLKLNHSLDKPYKFPEKHYIGKKFVFTNLKIVNCHLGIQLPFLTCAYILALKPCKFHYLIPVSCLWPPTYQDA